MQTSTEFIFDTPRSASRPKREAVCAKKAASNELIIDLTAVSFTVLLKDGKTIEIKNASSYQPEGPLTTFFFADSSRQTIDSWSTRVGSYRTADIVSIQRHEPAVLRVGSAPLSGPSLVAA